MGCSRCHPYPRSEDSILRVADDIAAYSRRWSLKEKRSATFGTPTRGGRAGSEMARRAEKAILTVGARAEIVRVKGPDDLERAFSSLKQAQVDGLFGRTKPDVHFSSQEVGRTGSESEDPRDLSILYLHLTSAA